MLCKDISVVKMDDGQFSDVENGTVTDTSHVHKHIERRELDMRLGLAVILSVCVSSALADKLPKAAKPLMADEVTQIYSDKSQFNKMSDIYYSADGTTKGVYGKPKVETAFAGQWRVTDNEMCMDNVSKADGKTYTDCNKFWRHKKKIYSLWTVHFDGSKVDDVDGYWTGEQAQLKPGDFVSKRYIEAGGS